MKTEILLLLISEKGELHLGKKEPPGRIVAFQAAFEAACPKGPRPAGLLYFWR
jgi:hypothetical protein